MESYPGPTQTNILKILIYDSQTNILCGANVNFTGCENPGRFPSVRSIRLGLFGQILKVSCFRFVGAGHFGPIS